MATEEAGRLHAASAVWAAGSECKLHAEAQLEHSIAVERDKVNESLLDLGPASTSTAWAGPSWRWLLLGVHLNQGSNL